MRGRKEKNGGKGGRQRGAGEKERKEKIKRKKRGEVRKSRRIQKGDNAPRA